MIMYKFIVQTTFLNLFWHLFSWDSRIGSAQGMLVLSVHIGYLPFVQHSELPPRSRRLRGAFQAMNDYGDDTKVRAKTAFFILIKFFPCWVDSHPEDQAENLS